MSLVHRWKSRLVLAVLVSGTALVLAVPASAGVVGSAHDFRGPQVGGPNTKYPALAALAGKNPCAACHVSHEAKGGSGQALVSEDYGWEPIRRISLPSSGLCMACHDGTLKAPTGEAYIKDVNKLVAQRHRRHKVEFPYPAKEGLLQTFGKLVKDQDGRYWVQAMPGVPGPRLPVYFVAEAGEFRAGCATCHNPHEPGKSGYFLRTTNTKELCRICHAMGG